jgi:hypothetical protein
VVWELERLKWFLWHGKQMPWTRRGAHLLPQTRVKTLNQEPGAVFQRWYPDL